MVNKEKQTVDGFGLPSTDKRKKDNALIEAARIADKIAKWKAEFDVVIPKEKGPLGPDPAVEEAKLKAIEDAKKIKEAADKAAKEIADKKAKLQAELDALDG